MRKPKSKRVFYSIRKKILSPQEIIKKACNILNVHHPDIMSESRKDEIVIARRKIMYYLYFDKHLTFQKIGDCFKKNHTTIMHNIREFANILDVNYQGAKDDYKRLKEQL